MTYPSVLPQTLPAVIRSWADRQPDAPAVLHVDGQLSYGELWTQARQWAGAIRPLLPTGADPTDAVVGVLVRRGPLAVVAQLAAWIAGAGYLPLDPEAPPGRLTIITDRADCAVVVTQEDLRHLLPPDVAAVTEPAEAVEPLPAKAADLAYVIYTSGSTGDPKGVEVEHGSLAGLMSWYADFYRLTPADRTSMLSHLGFDGLVVDVWGALYAGAAVAVPEQSVVTDPHRIAAFLDTYGVTHTNMPTPMLERFLASGARPGRVRAVETGGDQLRTWPGADYPAAVFNAYGPTEATVQVTITGDLRAAGRPDRLPPLGRALTGAFVYLLDADGQVVESPETPGELVITGPLLARGYRRAPDLTDAAFGPYGPQGERGYRTGDVCQWNVDGELEFLGRVDHQVKIRGYRVEPGEIEQQILRQPGVAMAVVVGAADGRLCAFAEGDGDPGAILAELGQRLPDYMVPTSLVFLDALPTTLNGKIDRRRLVSLGATVG